MYKTTHKGQGSTKPGRFVAPCVFLLGLAPLACEKGNTTEASGPEVRIALVVDGDDQEQVRRLVAMLRLAADEINEAGGFEIDGEARRLTIAPVPYDNSKTGRADAMTDMVSSNLHFGVGPNTSSAVLGQQSNHADGFAYLARDNGVILVSAGATNSGISDLASDGHQWRMAPPDDLQARVAATHLLQDRAVTSVAIIYRDDSYGVGLAAEMTAAFEEGGGTVLASVGFDLAIPDGDPSYDFGTELSAAFANQPQALYVIAGGEFVQIANNVILQGYWQDYGPTPPIIFTSDAAATFNLLSNGLPEMLDEVTGTAPSADASSEDYLEFSDALTKIQTQVLSYDPFYYDALYSLAYAIQKSGSVDPELVKSELVAVTGSNDGDVPIHVGEWAKAKKALLNGKDIDYEGASGPIALQDNGDPGGALYAIWRVQKQADGTYAYDYSNIKSALE